MFEKATSNCCFAALCVQPVSSLYVLVFVQIREELRANGIDVYPQKEFDEDADDRLINDKIRVSSVFSLQV